MTELYIVRHGETDANAKHACLGHADVPLNDKGREQTRLLAQQLIDVEFDMVYVSPLTRALDTAEPLKKKAPMTMSYGLIERDYGAWEGLSMAQIKEKHPEEYRKWQENWIDFVLPEGESAATHQERVNEIMDKIVAENDGKRVLIVTHLGTARHIISHVLGLESEQSWRFTIDNAGVALIQINEGKGTLISLNA